MYEKIGDKVYERKEVGSPRLEELKTLKLLKKGEVDRLEVSLANRRAELQKINLEINELKNLGVTEIPQ